MSDDARKVTRGRIWFTREYDVTTGWVFYIHIPTKAGELKKIFRPAIQDLTAGGYVAE